MWSKVLMKIKIMFMLNDPPLISIFQEDLILIVEIIMDGFLSVSTYPKLI